MTALSLGVLGDADANHLERAARMGYVFCTFDADFIEQATQGLEHAGIVFGQGDRHWIGVWVKGLELMYAVYNPDDMRNRVEYL